MTPEQFRDRMKEIDEKYGADTEAVHGMADDLMCELLREFGYGDGVEVFKKMHKWYA